jgi:hypothetical protein
MGGTVSGNFGWARWSNDMPVPGWFGAEGQGGGVAIADINGNGRPDLVVFHLDNPSGENHGYYRIGWNLDFNGTVQDGWSAIKQVPGWFGAEDQGGGIAISDINGNGRPDLKVFHLDNPNGENHGYYRIGWDLDANGDVQSWSDLKAVPGWFGAEDQEAGIAAFRYYGDGALVVAHADNPVGQNKAYYRVSAINQAGDSIAGWSDPIQMPTAIGSETQGVAVTSGYVAGTFKPDLIALFINKTSAGDTGFYFFADILVGVP